MMGMQQRPQPKANIQGLWDVLGIKAPGSENRMSPTGPLFQPDVVWQRGYNPYPRLERQQGFVEQWIFIAPAGFSADDAVTDGLQQVFFPAPG